MALDVNSQMPSQVGQTVTGTGPLTYSFTNTAGTLLVVGVVLGAPGRTISSVTYNGVAMKLEKSQISHDGATGALSALYTLLNPATGANNVVVNISGSSTVIISGAISFTGNHATTPVKASFSNKAGSGTTASVVVTNTTSGNIIVANMSNGLQIGTSSNTLTWLKNVDNNDYGDNGASGYASGTGGSVTMSWTGNGNDGWGIEAIEIEAAAGGLPIPVAMASYRRRRV